MPKFALRGKLHTSSERYTKARREIRMVEKMQYKEIIRKLESMSDQKIVEDMVRFGINPKNAYGISMPNLRKIAREMGKNHLLA